jgi:hypothetical protein
MCLNLILEFLLRSCHDVGVLLIYSVFILELSKKYGFGKLISCHLSKTAKD